MIFYSPPLLNNRILISKIFTFCSLSYMSSYLSAYAVSQEVSDITPQQGEGPGICHVIFLQCVFHPIHPLFLWSPSYLQKKFKKKREITVCKKRALTTQRFN